MMSKTLLFMILGLITLSLTGSALAEGYGFCSHLHRGDFYLGAETELKVMKANGASIIRFDFDWRDIEPRPGEYHFERYDRLFKLAAENGLEVETIFGSLPPKWARPIETHQEEFLRYVEVCTRHFKGKLRYVEIINEVNGAHPDNWVGESDPVAYTALLKKAYAIIKSIDPSVTVLFASIAGMYGPAWPFLRKAFAQEELKGHVDALNIHPYSWTQEPELYLPPTFAKFNALRREFKLDRLPVWVTEIGNSTGRDVNYQEFLPAAFKEAKLDPASTGIAFLNDEAYESLSPAMNFNLEKYVGSFKERTSVTSTELPQLDVKRFGVLLLPHSEALPDIAVDAITGYLKRGGTVISLYGFPGYGLKTLDHGRLTQHDVGVNVAKNWHVGLSAFWRPDAGKGAPRNFSSAFAEEPIVLRNGSSGEVVKACPYVPLTRHLTTACLKPGDSFTPLIFGKNGDYVRPIAGVYHFNSDLKGKFIISVSCDPMLFSTECSTLDFQARLLGRNLLLGSGLGADKIIIYKLRSSGTIPTREGHFGVVERDFTEKPALAAFRTLMKVRPDGSSPVTLRHQGFLWSASWRRPDKSFCTALWRVRGNEEVKLSGSFTDAVDYLGCPVKVDPKGFNVTDGIVYFNGEVKPVAW